MKTQQEYYDEMSYNWDKFEHHKDCYIKRRLRKLTTANLEHVLSLMEKALKDADTNTKGRPSEIAVNCAVTYARYKPIMKYINYLIDKRNKQEVA
tara:strand:- start:65 stop:349 length:285 start_codon:yes stop_codon:yes gene_type:complete